MIRREKIDGREALVADFKPGMVKIMFDDGEVRFAQAQPEGVLIGGHSLAGWAIVLTQRDLARIDNAIRTGLISGLDSAQIARTVIGSADMRGVDGVTEITRKEIDRLRLASLLRGPHGK